MEDKKKLGILTLYHNSYNYGGLLQAFALVKVLNMFDIDAYQVDYAPKRQSQSFHFYKEILMKQGLGIFLSKVSKNIVGSIYRHITNPYYKPFLLERRRVMDQFRNSIPHTEECDQFSIKEKCKCLDAFIVGSDQVWKPTVIDYGFSLAFCEEKPKMAYAASLSVDTIPQMKIAVYKEAIEKIDKVSVRESESIKLLSGLCPTKNLDCVCDPTMLLSRDEWLTLSENNKIELEKYVFCYFLGETKRHREVVIRYAKQRNLKIVTYPNLLGNQRLADKNFGDVKIYDSNPLGFVSLIANAELVFTDSFHAASFALYMHTPFYVFSRDAVFSMNSRITSLLGKMNLMDRFSDNHASFNALPIDWNRIDKIIENERNAGLEYIKSFIVNLG